MKITRIRTEGFRNLKACEIDVSPGMNVIYGDNAQGKTNMLEAIWLFSGLKSFRGAKEAEMVAHTKENARLTITFEDEERQQTAEIFIDGHRRVKINSVAQKAPLSLAGKIKMVVFSPSHLSLIKDGPEQRRRFIDSAVAQLWPNYISIMSSYRRSVGQRNALLKDLKYHPQLSDLCKAYEKSIARDGAAIIKYRKNYIELMNEFAPAIYSGISHGTESFDVSYETSVDGEKAEVLERALEAARERDLITGTTSVGPHRDDILIKINGLSARSYASQGQQRSAVLTLKLSESEIIKKISGKQPVALLDDVMSELDVFRQDYILNHIKQWQVFITCCDKNTVSLMKDGCAFLMKDGEILPDTEKNE